MACVMETAYQLRRDTSRIANVQRAARSRNRTVRDRRICN